MPGTQIEPRSVPKGSPVVIYATREADGYTYQLHPLSEDLVRQKNPAPKSFPRIFISQEVKEDFEVLLGPIAPELVLLLTGLRTEAIGELGGAQFRDPATDHVLFTWHPDRS